MAFDSTKVILGYDGQLLRGDVGTALPPDLATPVVTADWSNMGWCHEDGHTFNPNLQAPDPIKAWPRGFVVKRPPPTLEPEFTFQLIQTDDALDLLVNPDVASAWILEYKDTSTSALHRLIIPRATITDLSEITFNTTDPIGHEMTVGAVFDSAAVIGTGTPGFMFAFQVPGATAGTTVVKQY
jgi:hypothetical protein